MPVEWPLKKERDGREVIDGARVKAAVLIVVFAGREHRFAVEPYELDRMPLPIDATDWARDLIESARIEVVDAV